MDRYFANDAVDGFLHAAGRRDLLVGDAQTTGWRDPIGMNSVISEEISPGEKNW
jgi:hypothetical protein